MAQVIRQGQKLMNNVVSWDETRRFELILQGDGNLVVYAHLLHNNIVKRLPIGATHSEGAGPDVELDFTPTGALRLTNIISRQVKWVSRPERIGPIQFPPAPNASLHIQADGNAVVYANWPHGVLWASGELDLNRMRMSCVPGSLRIDIYGNIDGGEKILKNGQPQPITVNDGQQNVVVFPGQTLATTMTGYSVLRVLANAPGTGDAAPPLKPGPETIVI